MERPRGIPTRSRYAWVRLEDGRTIEQEAAFESDDPAFAGVIRMTWTFAPRESGTLVTIRAESVPEGVDPEDHEAAFHSTLANLAAFVERRGPAVVHDYPAIMSAILDGYTLPVRGDHGVVHWARVMENGLRIADANGADPEVVILFALFHDARRVNEYRDHGHGLRGGMLARSLRGTLLHLDDSRFELLFEACRLHTDGLTSGDPTLLACWDADRLDLGRVGITPDPRRLGTGAGRELLGWAHARAVDGYEPRDRLEAWGVTSVR